VPEFTERVEPMALAPEIVGAAVKVGGCVVAVVATEKRLVDPMLLVLVVLAVTNLPASAEVWV
jgi:hypothetical protein